jgi:hypothetical protein
MKIDHCSLGFARYNSNLLQDREGLHIISLMQAMKIVADMCRHGKGKVHTIL